MCLTSAAAHGVIAEGIRGLLAERTGGRRGKHGQAEKAANRGAEDLGGDGILPSVEGRAVTHEQAWEGLKRRGEQQIMI